MVKDAIISDCGLYRYRLSRVWNEQLPKCLFIMYNPSKADGTEDDPTLTRCINFAKSWGYGSLIIGNIYAYRSTDPDILKSVKDPYGRDNAQHLMAMNDECDITIVACGNLTNETASTLLNVITEDFKNVHYLRMTKREFPQHPLYLKSSIKPVAYGN